MVVAITPLVTHISLTLALKCDLIVGKNENFMDDPLYKSVDI